ncbi:hypothetical protein A4H97_24225 [Niastella yeongjuensis]|uniref:Uncharacterized protein n=1 Tax=Niastella yeongjuensis TaxID=354355 RepID=A0A1V9F339_9BACT|nr:hypothetical protein A4H97_24225 [Niastella yeongjuensis]SEP20271.1 hypothetical protein SAMN05660816_04733 [Niastella yeongjuensis]
MPVSVRNPYAELLQLPPCVFKPRRTNAHYLAYIEAITFYHQLQRGLKTDERTGTLYIETTIEDIKEANKLLSEILLRKSDELTGGCRGYLEQLKALLQRLEQTTFTNKDVRTHLRLPGTTVRRYNHELLQNGYIKLQEKDKHQGYIYEIASYEEYQQLQKSVTNVLNEVLIRLQTGEPPMSQTTTGSTKPKPDKKKDSASQ